MANELDDVVHKEMKAITLGTIKRAVSSITMTSHPTFRAGSIEARVKKANWPYVSRTRVTFNGVNKLEDGALFASSGKHAILITMAESNPSELLHPFSINNLVMEWEGGVVPAWVVRPVIDKIQEFCMCPDNRITDREMLYVYVLSPVLAGFHFEQPVFWLAAREKNKPAAINGKVVNTQGSLMLIRPDRDEEIRNRMLILPAWGFSPSHCEAFFNHIFIPSDHQPDDGDRQHLRPVAVTHRSITYAMLLLWGLGKITSQDHPGQDIQVDERYLVALHPFPRRGVD